jgi:hypothetical protein
MMMMMLLLLMMINIYMFIQMSCLCMIMMMKLVVLYPSDSILPRRNPEDGIGSHPVNAHHRRGWPGGKRPAGH